jgi:hypothetical protein
MNCVIIESPFSGDVERNLTYVRACMRDSFDRGESPFASHALYTQEGVLNDDVEIERKIGIKAGFMWRKKADFTAVYVDLGISPGMSFGIEDAHALGQNVEYRSLGGIWEKK